jgi:biotin operon repressor
MPYEQVLDIEQRFCSALRLICTGRYSTPALAAELGVSIPTVSRCVKSLRERGHPIKAQRTRLGWRAASVTAVVTGQIDVHKHGMEAI